MTIADTYVDAVRDAGLTGWRTAIRQIRQGRWVAALTSPDYNTVTGAGTLKVAAGKDAADAFAAVLEAVRGAVQ